MHPQLVELCRWNRLQGGLLSHLVSDLNRSGRFTDLDQNRFQEVALPPCTINQHQQ